MLIYGLHPVLEALRSGRVKRLRVGVRADRRIDQALALAGEMGVAVERVDGAVLQRLARGGLHQDIVAEVVAAEEYAVEDLVAAAGKEPALLVVLDSIEDPHNVGAILRTADAAACHEIPKAGRADRP